MLKRVALLGAAVAVVIAIFAFAYYRSLTAPMAISTAIPVAATLDTRSSAATEGESASQSSPIASDPQVYRIDPAGSEAVYRVNETFFDERGRATAVGRTRAVAGDILVDRANPEASRTGEIVVDVSQFRTDDPQRDNAVRRGYLHTDRYPRATFTDGVISGLPAGLRENRPFTFTLAGDLTVHGVTRPVTWTVGATLDQDTLTGVATTQVKLTDFDMEVPNLRILRAEDDVALEILFVARAVMDTEAARATPLPPAQARAAADPTVTPAVTREQPATCVPTGNQSGPNYRPGAPERSLGKGHVLSGTVRSSRDCAAVPRAKLEFWMAGPDGTYTDDYRATVYADEQGQYRFESVVPPAYGGGVPHIHMKVSAPGYRDAGTEYILSPEQTAGELDVVMVPLG